MQNAKKTEKKVKVKNAKSIPDFKRYLYDAFSWGPEWISVARRIQKLMPYQIGSPNALELDALGEILRSEHLRRDRINAIQAESIDWQIADELMQASIKSAESAIWKIESGQPIGKPKKRKLKGSSVKTEELEDEKIEKEGSLKGFKKHVSIGSASKDDALQSARLACLTEWNRIKHAFKPERKIQDDFLNSNLNLKRHMARISYRASLKDLTNWEGWRQKEWLVDDADENELKDVVAKPESDPGYLNPADHWYWEECMDQKAAKKGLLVSKKGFYEHAEFKKILKVFLKGRNPGKRSNNLQTAFRRYGLQEDTWIQRKIDRMNRQAEYYDSINCEKVSKYIRLQIKAIKKPKSLESCLCNLPVADENERQRLATSCD